MTVLASFRLSALAAFLTVSGCKKSEPEGTVLAQVEEARLTLEDMRENFPPEFEKILPREQYLEFIQRWINDEAVYQQAIKRKLDQDPKVRRRLERMQRKVILEEFLAREGAGEDYEPDEGAMGRYYEMHTDAFRRQTPEFRYVSIRTGSAKEALALRAKMKGDDFLSLAARNSPDGVAELPASIPFRKPSDIPTCLLDAMASAKPGILPPVSCQDGTYLVKLFERVEAGSLIPFAEAKSAISGQLAMEHRDRMREAKIRKYKEGLAISFDPDQIPGLEAPASASAGSQSSTSLIPSQEALVPTPDRLSEPGVKAGKPKKQRKAAAPSKSNVKATPSSDATEAPSPSNTGSAGPEGTQDNAPSPAP